MVSRVNGAYFDGQSAKSKEARAYIQEQKLLIDLGEGQGQVVWPVQDVELLSPIKGRLANYKGPVQLGLKSARGTDSGTLDLQDPDLLKQLYAAGASLTGRGQTTRQVLVAMGLVLGIGLCLYLALPFLSRQSVKLVTFEQERALGDQVADSLIHWMADEKDGEPQVCTGVEGQVQIDALTHKLLASLDSPYEYRVQVILNEGMMNAFAAPGGRIVFLSSILDEFENAEEFAAVLAHEMAHVEERHSLEGMAHALGVSILASVIVGDISGSLASVAVETLATSGHSRAAEAHADEEGMAILHAADISSTGFTSFFERLSQEYGEEEGRDGFLSLIASHPSSENRVASAQGKQRSLSSPMTDEEWQAVKNICQVTTNWESRWVWPF